MGRNNYFYYFYDILTKNELQLRIERITNIIKYDNKRIKDLNYLNNIAKSNLDNFDTNILEKEISDMKIEIKKYEQVLETIRQKQKLGIPIYYKDTVI